MRLSIFNSKSYIIYIIILFIFILTVFEIFHFIKFTPFDYSNQLLNYKKDKSKIAYVFGDSRGRYGIKPDMIRYNESELINFCTDLGNGGFVALQMYKLKKENITPDYLILALSPATLFATGLDSIYFESKLKKKAWYNNIASIMYNFSAFSYADKFVKNIISSNIRTSQGFKNNISAICEGELQRYTDNNGWYGTKICESDKAFLKEYERNLFSKTFLERNKDTTRLNYLKMEFESLIEEFSLSSKIFIVRLPISDEIKHIEDTKYPDFEKYIEDVSRKYNIRTLLNSKTINYSKDYSDGSHLERNEAIEYSKELNTFLNSNK